MRFLHLIFSSLLRSRRRMVLTLFSIALSMGLVAILAGLLNVMDQSCGRPEAACRIAVRHRTSNRIPLPTRYEEWIRQQPGVDSVMAMQWFAGVYQDRRNTFANYASEPEWLVRIWQEDIRHCPEAQYQAFAADPTGCVVGRALADKFGWHLGTVVPLQGTLFPFSPRLTIRCIFDGTRPSDELVLHFHYKLLEENVPSAKGRIGTLWVRAKSPAEVPGLTERIDRHFRDSADPTLSEPENTYRLEYMKMIGDYRLMIHAITSAVLAAMLLVTGGVMASVIRERATEVAMFRTIGFTGRQVLGLLLAEGAVLLLLGTLLGLALAALAGAGIRNELNGWDPLFMDFAIPREAILLCLKVALALGLLATWPPAYRAARRPIVDGLRLL